MRAARARLARRATALAAWLGVAVAAVAAVAAAAADTAPAPAAAYLLLRDGAPLAAHQADRRLAPASLTKMMTALIALEAGGLDTVVRVGPGVRAATGSKLGLRPGERMRLRDLLAASVIRSANDACRALAEHIGGSREGFVERMNRRAQAMGLADTHFADPCGHDRAGHYSTAADLARIAAEVARHPEYLRLAATVETVLTTVDGKRRFAIDNTNALVGRYAGAVGLKSGFTPKAGRCLAALAERDGVRVLLVMLDAPNRWWDAVELLDRAFAAGAGATPR